MEPIRHDGSPVSQGTLQVDTWGVTPSNRWDWAAFREMISNNGIRNSLLVAPMPTASTSQILGNNECFEPYTSNIYTRRVLTFKGCIICGRVQPLMQSSSLWTPPF